MLWLQQSWADAGRDFDGGPDDDRAEQPSPAAEDAPSRREGDPGRRDRKTSPSDRPGQDRAEVALADQEEKTPGVAADRVTTAVEHRRPFRDRLSFSRALHRLSTVRPSPVDRVIDVDETVRATAAAGGSLQIVFGPVNERFTHLLLIEDRAATMVPWRGFGRALAGLAREVGSFAGLSTVQMDTSAPGRLLLNQGRRKVTLGELCPPGRDHVVLLLSDGLAPAATDGRLEQCLRNLPASARVAWLHPWGRRWKRTPLARLRISTVGRVGTDTRVTVPVVPMAPEGVASLEPWARNRSGGVPLGRRIPEAAADRAADPVPAVPVDDIDWMAEARLLAAEVSPTTLEVLALAAAVPGRGVNLELLFSLAEKFMGGSASVRRHHLAEAIASGFFQIVNDTGEDRVVLGFRSPAARESLRAFLDHDRVGDVLQFLVDSYLDDRGEMLAPELQIPVDLLVRIAQGDGAEDVPHAQAWGEDVVASLVSVTRSTRSDRWRFEPVETRRVVPGDGPARGELADEAAGVDGGDGGGDRGVDAPSVQPRLAGTYAGRDRELAEATELMCGDEGAGHLLVTGPFRMGKSGFLHELAARVLQQRPEAVVVRVTGAELTSPFEGGVDSVLLLGLRVALGIDGEFDLDAEPMDQLREWMRRREAERREEASPADQLYELLDALGADDRPILLFIDDFDLLVGHFKRVPDWLVMLVVAPTSSVRVVGASHLEPAAFGATERSAQFPMTEIPLGPFAKEACVEVVRLLSTQYGFVYSEDVALKLYRWSGGHPYLLQHLLQELLLRHGPLDSADELELELRYDRFVQLESETLASFLDMARFVGAESGEREAVPTLLSRIAEQGYVDLSFLDERSAAMREFVELVTTGLFQLQGERVVPVGDWVADFVAQRYGRDDLIESLPTSVAREWSYHPSDETSSSRLATVLRTAELLLHWITQILLGGVYWSYGGNLPRRYGRALMQWSLQGSFGGLAHLCRTLLHETAQPPIEHPFHEVGSRLLGHEIVLPQPRGDITTSLVELRNWHATSPSGLSNDVYDEIVQRVEAAVEESLRGFASASTNLEFVGVGGGRKWRWRGVEPTELIDPRQLRSLKDGLWIFADDQAQPLWPMITVEERFDYDDEPYPAEMYFRRDTSGDGRFGYEEVFPAGGSGEAGDDEVRAFERLCGTRAEAPHEILVAVLGRPKAGKSTLINWLFDVDAEVSVTPVGAGLCEYEVPGAPGIRIAEVDTNPHLVSWSQFARPTYTNQADVVIHVRVGDGNDTEFMTRDVGYHRTGRPRLVVTNRAEESEGDLRAFLRSSLDVNPEDHEVIPMQDGRSGELARPEQPVHRIHEWLARALEGTPKAETVKNWFDEQTAPSSETVDDAQLAEMRPLEAARRAAGYEKDKEFERAAKLADQILRSPALPQLPQLDRLQASWTARSIRAVDQLHAGRASGARAEMDALVREVAQAPPDLAKGIFAGRFAALAAARASSVCIDLLDLDAAVELCGRLAPLAPGLDTQGKLVLFGTWCRALACRGDLEQALLRNDQQCELTLDRELVQQGPQRLCNRIDILLRLHERGREGELEEAAAVLATARALNEELDHYLPAQQMNSLYLDYWDLRIAARQGQVDRVRELLADREPENLLHPHPDHLMIRHMGEALARAGRIDAALAWLDRAVTALAADAPPIFELLFLSSGAYASLLRIEHDLPRDEWLPAARAFVEALHDWNPEFTPLPEPGQTQEAWAGQLQDVLRRFPY